MKYEIELPLDIERRLTERASVVGGDVASLIRTAVVRFIDDETDDTSSDRCEEWTDEVQLRRNELIDKDIAGTISARERRELQRLDRLANEHFDLVAPPPLNGTGRV